MRVCVCACMRVCVYAHFADVSKIAQDAPGATTQSQSEGTQAPGRPQIKIKYTKAARSIGQQ